MHAKVATERRKRRSGHPWLRLERDMDVADPTLRLKAVTWMCQMALAPFGSGFCGDSPETALEKS